ncbi:MAG: methyltransferase domain-containing protein [Planctomycetota bacterium]|jgi:tellurite methyltransferase
MPNNKPWWEANYQKQASTTDAFGDGKPNPEICELIGQLPANAKILDMGCGDGRNALFLAKSGFRVKAIDISSAGIDKLSKIAEQNDLSIDTEIMDMRNLVFNETYDLIIATYSFYLIEREYWMRLINDMKANTKPGGYNAVSNFTDKIPAPDDLREFAIGMFKEGELFDLYQDWEIVFQKSFVDEDEHPGGIKHQHAVNKIIARKK